MYKVIKAQDLEPGMSLVLRSGGLRDSEILATVTKTWDNNRGDRVYFQTDTMGTFNAWLDEDITVKYVSRERIVDDLDEMEYPGKFRSGQVVI